MAAAEVSAHAEEGEVEGEGGGGEEEPVPAGEPAGGGAPGEEKKVRKKKKKPAAPTVFESTPQPTKADVRYGAHDQVGGCGPSVFESQPKPATVDASARLNGQATAAGVEPTSGTTVFESTPAPSRADVHHGSPADHARAAEQLIHAAAEQGTATAPSTFESRPQKSTATVTYADRVQAVSDCATVFESQPKPSTAAAATNAPAAPAGTQGASAGVYESAPVPSKADVTHGGPASLARAAKDLIEAAAELHVQDDSPAQPSSKGKLVTRADEALRVIQAAADAHSGGMSFVFESTPVPSKASARHGQPAAAESSGEEETESEDSPQRAR